MSGFLNKAKNITGLGLDHDELYNRAYAKGVMLTKWGDAADLFDKAAKKFSENGNQAMAAQAAANSLLYRYLDTGDSTVLVPLVKILQGLQQIEKINSREFTSVAPLYAELDCRLVEAAIASAQNDPVRSRDLHKIAHEKFEAIKGNPLITYIYPRTQAPDLHNDRTEMRSYFHEGMYFFYKAMTQKDVNPNAAYDDLINANDSFKLCNDQKWDLHTRNLSDKWSDTRTCWICHRNIQGKDLHFSMCHADVTEYMLKILEKAHQQAETIDLVNKQIAVCTPCGSMITYKAEIEADKVRRELNAKIVELLSVMEVLENRINRLERMSHHH